MRHIRRSHDGSILPPQPYSVLADIQTLAICANIQKAVKCNI